MSVNCDDFAQSSLIFEARDAARDDVDLMSGDRLPGGQFSKSSGGGRPSGKSHPIQCFDIKSEGWPHQR
ncbi:Hypothetical protein NTJ_14770 [Nesidiocoris tenuis]|uniref:Uncharacterized protein n=1 Tax=Nesidiocoris tenuis TaxID=355587 RepID=A0ABN7BC58_9HEMI|nr:Hypothetical protein NTJ_14770 [Nesidiocoris tenuis]